ncbi:xylulokinase [Actinotalea sp. Marseille-Q4924]|uniref:xylulokinase n=1 Tax=Actinotalea sp. Marseille-Q4924 TaxID=2866571 RepID=UPI001CE44B2E|nr:FGGY-family carbohydrate kinase [Actinotalea sp. Marseille-Q4924]
MGPDHDEHDHRDDVTAGRAVLGIELGSTRIKAVLVGRDGTTLAAGGHDWENQLVDGRWTYALEAVWSGLQSCVAALQDDVERRYGARLTDVGALGVSAMMHGYLPFDADGELLVPFRTWRNTSTGAAAAELSELLGHNIPLRWSVAHLYQAVLDDEPHLAQVDFLTTLAGYVHWRLTGRKVLGVGDASGMFPIDPATRTYDARMLAAADERIATSRPGLRLTDLLPEVLVAGQEAGRLTPEGAALLDPTGTLRPGAALCPPEGDAGTGMVATNAVAPRTGNVSVGTSVFAMVVLERPLERVHHELDVVTTPAGDLVAMVHCNNGASELGAWAEVFGQFAAALGTPAEPDAVFGALLREALTGEADAGGVVAYNYLAGEPITGLAEGRPLILRTPDSRLTLGNVVRAQVYGVFGTLSLGMRVLAGEGVELDTLFAHGGLFRTAGVAQRLLAAAVGAPVAVARTASEGGPWGMAALAAYLEVAGEQDLQTFLDDVVFADAEVDVVEPDADDVAGYAVYLERYSAGLAAQRAAVASVPAAGATDGTAAGATDGTAAGAPGAATSTDRTGEQA